jgi:hypothetical protein
MIRIWFKSLDCVSHHHYYTLNALPATLKQMVIAQDTAAD